MKLRTNTLGWIVLCLGLATFGCDDGSALVRRRMIEKGGTGGAGPGPTTDGGALRSGPFRMLVLSTVLEYIHPSIPAGQQMLRDLGATADADLPRGAQPGSQFTVDIAADDLSDFTTENLKNYEIIFWMNPTGTVFTSGGTSGDAAAGAAAKKAVEAFMSNGGTWAGVHSATDFEKTAQWTWFQDLVGGYFDRHDDDGTLGAVAMQPTAVMQDHPVVRGLPATWNVTDEWYYMNRDPQSLPGYQVVAKLAADQRPVSWIHELAGGGRVFYTIRGHNSAVYYEPDFRRHVHEGILWAVHRMR
ncbi:MAG: ThuA domain-containing protein [Myxococcales bacterium]